MSNRNKPKRLKKYRLEKGISIYDLADIIGTNYSTISYWENGKKFPRHEKIIALEDYFRKPYRDLFSDLTEEELRSLEGFERTRKSR